MVSTFFKKSNLVLFLSAILMSSAKADQMPCPAVDLIKQQITKSIFPLEQDGDIYTVATIDPFQDDNGAWVVLINVTAKSEDEAILLGKESLKNLNLRKTEFGERTTMGFVCNYGPGEVSALGGWVGTP